MRDKINTQSDFNSVAHRLRQTLTQKTLAQLLGRVITDPAISTQIDEAIGSKADKPIKSNQAQELVARMIGYRDANTAKASLEKGQAITPWEFQISKADNQSGLRSVTHGIEPNRETPLRLFDVLLTSKALPEQRGGHDAMTIAGEKHKDRYIDPQMACHRLDQLFDHVIGAKECGGWFARNPQSDISWGVLERIARANAVVEPDTVYTVPPEAFRAPGDTEVRHFDEASMISDVIINLSFQFNDGFNKRDSREQAYRWSVNTHLKRAAEQLLDHLAKIVSAGRHQDPQDAITVVGESIPAMGEGWSIQADLGKGIVAVLCYRKDKEEAVKDSSNDCEAGSGVLKDPVVMNAVVINPDHLENLLIKRHRKMTESA